MAKETQAVREAYDRLRLIVVAGLKDRSLAKVARIVGLHENTVRRVASGDNKKPTVETLEKLADYLTGEK